MNKLILVFVLSFYSDAFAVQECPGDGIPREKAVDNAQDLGNVLSCEFEDIKQTEKYSPKNCGHYDTCTSHQTLTPDQRTNRRKEALKNIATTQGKYLLGQRGAGIKAFAGYDSVKDFLGEDVNSQKLNCDSPIKVTFNDKCDQAVLNTALSDEERKIVELYNSDNKPKGRFIAVFKPLFDFDTKPYGGDAEKALQAFKETEEYKKIEKLLGANSFFDIFKRAEIHEKVEAILKEETPEAREKLFKLTAGSMAHDFAQKQCKKFKTHNFNLQNYCEEMTRLSKGIVQKGLYVPNEMALNDIYKDENPAADLYTNRYRCELFDIQSQFGSMFTFNSTKEKEYKSWKEKAKEAQQDLDEAAGDVVKSFADVDFSKVKNNGDIITLPDSKSIGTDFPNVNKTLGDASFNKTVEKNIADGPANTTNMTNTIDELKKITATPTAAEANAMVNNPAQPAANYVPSGTTLPPVPPIPPSDALVGVDNVLGNSSGNKVAETTKSAAEEKLSAQLAETQKQLKELQNKANENEKKMLEKQLASQQEALNKLKDAPADSVKPNDAAPFATELPKLASSQDNQQQLQAQLAHQAAQQQAAQRPEEVSRAPASNNAIPSLKQASVVGASSAGSSLLLTLVEMPKGVDSQNEAAVSDFLNQQIIKFEGKPFIYIHPTKGELEVIPSKGTDGKYVYVTRPVKKIKKVAEKKVEPKVNRAPAADDAVQIHLYQDMKTKIKEAAKKGE